MLKKELDLQTLKLILFTGVLAGQVDPQGNPDSIVEELIHKIYEIIKEKESV